MAAPILWTPGKNAFFLQENPFCIKFLVLGGGGISGFGGGYMREMGAICQIGSRAHFGSKMGLFSAFSHYVFSDCGPNRGFHSDFALAAILTL